MKKKILILNLLAAIICAGNAMAASSGSCGTSCQYTLDDNGLLTVSGTGEMLHAPWRENINSVQNVVIENGITSIDYDAFYGAANLTSVVIPNSVTSIGYEAFYGTTSLTSIVIPDSVTSIGDRAFYGTTSLTDLTIPAHVELFYSDDTDTFDWGYSLTDVENMRPFVTEETYQAWYQIALDNGCTHEEDSCEIPPQGYDLYANVLYGVNFDQVTIHCSGNVETCQENIAAAKYEEGTYTVDQATPQSNTREEYNSNDGSYTIYDKDNNIIGYKNKRIYTVQEANQVSKPTGNRVSIRYK